MAIDETDADSLWVLPGPHPSARMGAPNRGGHDALSAGEESKSGAEPGNAVQSGDLLASRFKIGNRIGQGGMGTVYEARDTLRGEAVAIKVLVSGLLQDREAIRQFQSEAAIATRLSHPNIVTVYDFHANDGTYAIVMERMHGKTLRDEIRERKNSGIPFATAEIEGILGPVCEALEYAHTFTVHRDVKPENIWIGEDGTIKLMDFGLAMLVQRGAAPLSMHTLSQLRLGSPYYMAPEQLQDARQATAAADQFAVGVIAYELLSGALPMGLAKPLRELRPDLPYRLTDVVDRALANAPEARFRSVATFWEVFQSGCRSRRSWRQHLDTRPVLRKSVIAAAVAGGLALVGGWGFSIIDQRADTLLARTGEASNAVQEARLEISAVRQLVDEMRRTRAEAGLTLKTVREKAAPDADDIHGVLQREIELAREEQSFARADRAWRLLLPRLSDERTPSTLTNRLTDLEETLRTHDFRGFAQARSFLQDEIANEREAFSRIRALAASQVAVAALSPANGDAPAGDPSDGAMVGADAAVAFPLSDADLGQVLTASQAIEETLTEQLGKRFDELVASHEKALARWQALFPKTGPPPIEFLGNPEAKAHAAGDWQSLKRHDRAIPLLKQANATVYRWVREVEDLHERCDDMWTKAKAEGRAFENALGMRFVHIGEGQGTNYWSIWETRVMDFAWFVASEGFGSENAGTFWMDPGFPIGPTHPVVGLEPDLAGEFGRWLARHFMGTDSEGLDYGLPTIELYGAMLAREPAWRASLTKRAVFPDNNRLKNRHWLNEWADPDVLAERYIHPVGLGKPSAQGLYDLTGNVWEWAGDFLPSKGNANHHGRDYQFHVLYGGGVFGHISFDGHDPPTDHIFVGRHDALGFRLITNARAVHKLLGKEWIGTRKSPNESP